MDKYIKTIILTESIMLFAIILVSTNIVDKHKQCVIELKQEQEIVQELFKIYSEENYK